MGKAGDWGTQFPDTTEEAGRHTGAGVAATLGDSWDNTQTEQINRKTNILGDRIDKNTGRQMGRQKGMLGDTGGTDLRQSRWMENGQAERVDRRETVHKHTAPGAHHGS